MCQQILPRSEGGEEKAIGIRSAGAKGEKEISRGWPIIPLIFEKLDRRWRPLETRSAARGPLKVLSLHSRPPRSSPRQWGPRVLGDARGTGAAPGYGPLEQEVTGGQHIGRLARF